MKQLFNSLFLHKLIGNKRKPSFKKSIILNSLLLAILPIFIFGIVVINLFLTQTTKEVFSKTMILSNSLADEMERFLSYIQYDFTQIKHALESKNFNNKESIYNHINELSRNHKFFKSVRIVNNRKEIVFVSPADKSLIGYSMSRNPAVLDAVKNKNITWSSPFYDLESDSVTMTVSQRFEGGILIGFVKLEILKKIIDRIQVADNYAFAYITDTKGNLVAHPKKKCKAFLYYTRSS